MRVPNISLAAYLQEFIQDARLGEERMSVCPSGAHRPVKQPEEALCAVAPVPAWPGMVGSSCLSLAHASSSLPELTAPWGRQTSPQAAAPGCGKSRCPELGPRPRARSTSVLCFPASCPASRVPRWGEGRVENPVPIPLPPGADLLQERLRAPAGRGPASRRLCLRAPQALPPGGALEAGVCRVFATPVLPAPR